MKHFLSSTTFTATAAVVVACVVGTILDNRIDDSLSASDRIMVKKELFLDAAPEKARAVQTQIEKLSGIKGAPLLSLEEWVPVNPVIVDGVDVSNLFSGELSYKRSLEKNFQFSKLVLDASFGRPGTFFDFGVSGGADSAVIVRLSGSGVATFNRAAGGVLEPVESAKAPLPVGCSRFEVLQKSDSQSVVCQGITVAEIKAPFRRQARVFVASNLTRGEVRELSISE
jgi:hypothetical protein